MAEVKVFICGNDVGSGHKARLRETIPLFEQHAEVMYMKSGSTPQGKISTGREADYSFQGFNFVYRNGGVDKLRALMQIANLGQAYRDIIRFTKLLEQERAATRHQRLRSDFGVRNAAA
jgi:hypothetical protein